MPSGPSARAGRPVRAQRESLTLRESRHEGGRPDAARTGNAVRQGSGGAYKARLGVRMFAFYTVFYAGFVAINLLSPPTMATIVVAGLNLATVYGMALIVAGPRPGADLQLDVPPQGSGVRAAGGGLGRERPAERRRTPVTPTRRGRRS